jgi:hypothetical protein
VSRYIYFCNMFYETEGVHLKLVGIHSAMILEALCTK